MYPQPTSHHSTPHANEKHTSSWIVTALLLIFPPIAWYFMYKEKFFREWFPHVLLFYAVPYVLVFLGIVFYILPPLTEFYVSIGVLPSVIQTYGFLVVGIMIMVLQIVYAVVLGKKMKKRQGVTHLFLDVAIVFLIVDLFASGIVAAYLNISIIFPLYNFILLIK